MLDTVTRSEGWLQISDDGFAAMNADRPPAHLVKELVQNAFDAVNETGIPGMVGIAFAYVARVEAMNIACEDTGCGIDDISQLRRVYWTNKTDSHLRRGRMGRGFKEMLCLADNCWVDSNGQFISFYTHEGEKRVEVKRSDRQIGTMVHMVMRWPPDTVEELELYFRQLIVPADIMFQVNGEAVQHRRAVHIVEGSLSTEVYNNGRWRRSPRTTPVELVRIDAQEIPMIYEMGIPVCPAEWDQPYHINVLQRVPMNPNRDAVASGYVVKVHQLCLSVLIDEMSTDSAKDDWVGPAVRSCDEVTQKKVIAKAFGSHVARSVPAMGSRQFDEDYRDSTPGTVIDTRTVSGGFREVLQAHVPTTREVVIEIERERLEAAADEAFDLADDNKDLQKELVKQAGGRERVNAVLDFARWFCQKLLEPYDDGLVVSTQVAILRPHAIATWESGGKLTLGIDEPCLWADPTGGACLSILIHEAAHHMNMHHGRDFRRELQVLAGRAASIMFHYANEVQSRSLLLPASR